MHNNKLTVVQIIDRLNVGGAERVLVTLSNILYEHGHTVKVITTVISGPLAAQLHEGIQLVNLDRKWKWNLLIMLRLIKEVKAFDVIHVHSAHNLRYLFLATTLMRFRKVIFYHEHHGAIVQQKPNWLQQYIYPKTIFIAASEQISTWAKAQLRMPDSKVFVLPNIVLKEEVSPKNLKKYHHVKLLLASNFSPVKNLEFAIEILKQLLKNNNKLYTLAFIGKKADESYYQLINKIVRESRLSDKVKFIHDCNNIQPLLADYHLGLHTSVSESGPLVLIEYMAQGLPFVSFNTGGVVQQIKGDLPEVIVDDFNINTWIERINSLLHHPNRDHIHRTIQKVFETYYSPQRFYDRCIDIYNNGLNN
jgi:glycosyltransferase involved in cell wall biosynthesis